VFDTLRSNPKLAIAFDKAWRDYEIQLQQELTKRHEADMQSDSWLSKNVRPHCLVGLIMAITISIYLPDAYGKRPTGFTCFSSDAG
jgi:hypothetical protein